MAFPMSMSFIRGRSAVMDTPVAFSVTGTVVSVATTATSTRAMSTSLLPIFVPLSRFIAIIATFGSKSIARTGGYLE